MTSDQVGLQRIAKPEAGGLRAWPKSGTRCEFAGCRQRAYALVADVDRAIYVCRECYDRRERER